MRQNREILKCGDIAEWSKAWAEERKTPCRFFSSVDSVNNAAKRKAFKLKRPEIFKRLFIAETQTAGRGRGQNLWEDSDLMAAWLWEGERRKAAVSSLDRRFAENLALAAGGVWPDLPWRLKYPNDLCLEDKKTAGILIEVLDQGLNRALISGLGFNVLSHPPLLPQAGHLQQWTQDITQTRWEDFLQRLHFLWMKTAAQFLNPSDSENHAHNPTDRV